MKTIILLCVTLLFAGCAHDNYRGTAPRQSSFETGSHHDDELLHRDAVSPAGQYFPGRSGVGGLGRPE
jgi:hypothetical protein